ncbi:hypothetical protein ABZU88_32540 [Streptomyces sp. NPDC005245]|uniref:hypothetical protein n=1 Tax=Streptomyces sp. NPDC005245 TaxID=3157029 RepID=UPI0033A9E765
MLTCSTGSEGACSAGCRHPHLDSLFIDPGMAEDAWADVADSDPSDPWRRTVEQWLDKELPAWTMRKPSDWAGWS